MVAMTNTEKLICALIGPAKGDIRPLAMSIDLLNETLFLEDGKTMSSGSEAIFLQR